MIVNTVCYKTISPIYYNKGTEHEKSCDEFLLRYAPFDLEKAKNYIKLLNELLEAKDFPKLRKAIYDNYNVNLENIKYFFLSAQEEFD